MVPSRCLKLLWGGWSSRQTVQCTPMSVPCIPSSMIAPWTAFNAVVPTLTWRALYVKLSTQPQARFAHGRVDFSVDGPLHLHLVTSCWNETGWLGSFCLQHFCTVGKMKQHFPLFTPTPRPVFFSGPMQRAANSFIAKDSILFIKAGWPNCVGFIWLDQIKLWSVSDNRILHSGEGRRGAQTHST